ncbi:hypothetical protein J1605_015481 [Eschrichtius robustus]|uniref:Uncharacterized protein n=1 Tax=Eschrichtius robustus TaxID=9764 RepID=A0AB34GAL6_ESCRO|nr:hypothetical protein J1605_015481 [Eschrichtius robustus]
MLRAVVLAAARPWQGSRLLSAAATPAVPAPNQQPEVFYNKVRPPQRFVLWGRRPPGGEGLDLFGPQFIQLGLEGFAAVAVSAPLPFPACEQFGPFAAPDTSVPLPSCDFGHLFVLSGRCPFSGFHPPPPPPPPVVLGFRALVVLCLRRVFTTSPTQRTCPFTTLFAGTVLSFRSLLSLDSCSRPRTSKRKNKKEYFSAKVHQFAKGEAKATGRPLGLLALPLLGTGKGWRPSLQQRNAQMVSVPSKDLSLVKERRDFPG